MEEWDPAINDFVLKCNSWWRTNKNKHINNAQSNHTDKKFRSPYDNGILDAFRLALQFYKRSKT
jgi:hypothetical protein